MFNVFRVGHCFAHFHFPSSLFLSLCTFSFSLSSFVVRLWVAHMPPPWSASGNAAAPQLPAAAKRFKLWGTWCVWGARCALHLLRHLVAHVARCSRSVKFHHTHSHCFGFWSLAIAPTTYPMHVCACVSVRLPGKCCSYAACATLALNSLEHTCHLPLATSHICVACCSLTCSKSQSLNLIYCLVRCTLAQFIRLFYKYKALSRCSTCCLSLCKFNEC